MGKKPAEGNSKKAAGNARKEANANAKKEEELKKKQAIEDAEWGKGAKATDKKAAEEEKKKEVLRKKAEKEALLKAEEEELGKIKPQQRAKEFKINSFQANPVESFSASGIDAAIDMMSVVKSGAKATSSDKLDRHPERRVKSAYLQFQEDRMPQLKAENPKLRLSQLNELLQKEWKKSPQNPMNQEHLAHNTSKQEERDLIAQKKAEKLDSYRS